MLSCYVSPTFAPSGFAPSGRVIADWYRIVSVGDVVTGSSPASRWVTLQGIDWPLTQIFNNGSGPTTLQTLMTAAGSPPQVFATIVDGVTGVYQKTITLDGSSSWQP
jgi:hypothetical protein